MTTAEVISNVLQSDFDANLMTLSPVTPSIEINTALKCSIGTGGDRFALLKHADLSTGVVF